MPKNKNIRLLLDYFEANKLWDITWAHAVNSKKRLNRFSKSNEIMMIEGDVSLSDKGKIIIAHSLEASSDVTYDDWIQKITESRKGAKLDFKNPVVVPQCLKKLQELKLDIPVFLHADILEGPGDRPSLFKPNIFIHEYLRYYPNAIFSLGWTTEYVPGGGYTDSMLKKMMDVIQFLGDTHSCTISIRVCFLKSIPQSFFDAVKLKDNTFITLWNGKEDPPLPNDLTEYVDKNIGLEKVTYDLIDRKGDPIRL